MSGPWEKFQQADPQGKPWERFQATPVPTEPEAPTKTRLDAIAAPNWIERQLAKLPSMPAVLESNLRGLAMGAADPTMGAAQLVTGGMLKPLNEAIDSKNAEYEAGRKAAGRDGIDASRLVGNVASPANVAIAYAAPIKAATMLGKAAQGAKAGAMGGAMAPVLNADESFVGEKVLQTGAGAVAGGVLAPAAGWVGGKITRAIAKPSAAQISQDADAIMREGINRLQRDGITLNQFDIDGLRRQVLQSLADGKKIDAAALFRKADFKALGMKPTLGQITRDGAQFSREKNLRGLAGVGDPLLQRFDDQARRLQELITGKSAGALDDFTAGQQMMTGLKNVDESMRKNVSSLYTAARNSAGKDIDIPLQGLAQDYADTLSAFGDKVPSGVRNQFEALGLGRGTQQKIFNFEEADKLLKVINDNVSNDPAVNNALAQLRNAVKNAAISVDATGGPFAPAVAAAKQRFSVHDAVPALKAAATGDVSAQDFLRRFLINGKAEEVAGMAKVLPPDVKAEARRQLGAALERAAFGQNVAGDKAIAQESFAKFLNQPGMKQKLGAFFTPQEVQELERISRVAAYTSSFPANATVNTSNTAGALFNLMNRIPGVPASVGLLQSAKNVAGNHMAVNSALKSNPANVAADIPPEQLKLLGRILGGGMGGVGGAAGSGIGN